VKFIWPLVLLLSLSFVGFGPNSFAQQRSSEQPTESISVSSDQMLAKRKRRKIKRRKRRRKNRKNNLGLIDDSQPRQKKYAIRGLLGVVTGTSSEETLLLFGGEGLYFLFPNFSINGGLIYHTQSVELLGTVTSITMTQVGVGGYYHFWLLDDRLSLNAGIRGESATIAVDIEAGLLSKSATISAFLMGLGFGATYRLDMMTFGVEFRKPVSGGVEDIEFTTSGMYVLGSLGIAL
jgi:hypothetical protein